jgi:N utilization substance protein A
VNAAREPGRRAKISVYSTDEDVDPVGSCVGMRGSRVQTIVNDLNGEKIDIVRWSEDLDQYTANALAPAEIESLEIDEEANQIDVIVAQNQLSLAIGHKGQNVRLASKLIGYKINIVGNEVEELSIDEQLEKELAKTKDIIENSLEASAELTENNDEAESETAAEVESPAEELAEVEEAKADAPAETEEAKADAPAETEEAKADVTAETEEAKADVPAEVEEAKADVTAETEAVVEKTKTKVKAKAATKTKAKAKTKPKAEVEEEAESSEPTS